MNYLKTSVYACVMITSLLLFGCGKKQAIEYDAIPAGASVLAFGDSVTSGYGVSKPQSYPSQLAMMTDWNISNAGVSGDTALKAKQRIAGALAQYQPKLVLIELGGNDFLQRRRPEAVKQDLREIIQAVKQTDAIPVLVAVPALSPLAVIGMPSDSPIYQELADEEQIVLIKSVFSMILGNSELRADQIHPNAKGYQLLAEAVAEQLRESGLLEPN